MVKRLDAGPGHFGLEQRLEASIDAGLGHTGSGFIASPMELSEPGSIYGLTASAVPDDPRPVPLLVGQSRGMVFKHQAQSRVKPISWRVKTGAGTYAISGIIVDFVGVSPSFGGVAGGCYM
jgi:hypothetical protein